MFYEDETAVSTVGIDRKFWDYFDSKVTSSHNWTTAPTTLEPWPRDLGLVLATYSVLFVIGACGNLAVLVTLAKSRRRTTRVDFLMTHLAIADVCVTCGVIPLEIAWKYTNAWLVGNLSCKLLLVLRAFGLYLSSNVLVCISLDRFFAVLYPLRLHVARRRSKQMLCVAWTAALACSWPQSIVFRVQNHPRIPEFEQCVSFDAFATPRQEIAYNVFCICAMYFVPLVVITVCYLCIFHEIHTNSKELSEKCYEQRGGGGAPCEVRLRRTGRRVVERARRRTLRMTVTIVAVFALCWLPYATMAMWYMVDRESASRVSPRVQDLLFAMAVSNSCMNPLVYGSYALDLRGALKRMFRNTCCVATAASDTLGNSGSGSSKNKQNLDVPLILKKGRVRPRLGVRFAETTLTGAEAPRTPRTAHAPRAPRAPA